MWIFNRNKKEQRKLEKAVKNEIIGKPLGDQCHIISHECVSARKREIKNDNDVFKISIQEFKKYGIQVLEEKNLSPKSCSLICKKNDEIIEFIIINEGDPAYKQINDDFMQEERKFFNSESCFRLYYCGWSCNIY